MYRGLSVAVVVPAFNEEAAVGATVADIPVWIDWILVVDDASADRTAAVAAARADSRVEVIGHPENRGVGAAIITGYRRALALGCDVVTVMAGDGQMDPADLPALLDPLAAGAADYAKGNRFLHPDIWRVMPRTRLLGNIALSLATRWTSGYHQLFDSQCGYTAIGREILERLDLDRVFPRYGYPNDLLARLHTVGARVCDVAVRPIYGSAWKSGIRPSTVVYPVSFVLLRSFLERVTTELRPRRLRPPIPETSSL
jgi:glycosyltransferase involved in cell wall biosynthesis